MDSQVFTQHTIRQKDSAINVSPDPWTNLRGSFFYFFLEYFFKLFQLGPDNKIAIGLISIVVKIILMIIFSWIKIFQWGNFSDDRIIKCLLIVKFLFVVRGNFLLFFIVIKDNRPVLSAHIISLAIEGCRIVRLPEDL